MYLCLLEEKNSDLLMFKAEYEHLRVKQSSNEQICEQNQKVEVQQLGRPMNLVKISPPEAEELGLSINLHEDDFESNDSMEVHNNQFMAEKHVLGEQEQKMAKIESSLWGKKELSELKFLKYLFLAIIFFVIAVLCVIGTMQYSAYKVKKGNNFVISYSNLMALTQGCEMRSALYSYLMSKIQLGKLNNKICSSTNISDFKAFLKTKCNLCVQNRMNSYFINYYNSYNSSKEDAPIFDPSFIQALGIQTDVPLDYSNYLIGVATAAVQYMAADFNYFHVGDQQIFIKFVREHSNVNHDSFSYKFINSVGNQTLDKLNINNIDHQIMLSISTMLTSLCFFLFIIFTFSMYIEYLKYFNLLNALSQAFYSQQLHIAKFILKELQKLQDFNFKKCTFPSHDQIKLETVTIDDKTQSQLKINNFQSLALMKVRQKSEPEEQLVNQSTLKNAILSKKLIIMLALSSCVGISALSSLIGGLNQKKLVNYNKLTPIIRDGGITKETMMSMNFANWMNFVQEKEIRTPQQNEQFVLDAYNFVKKANLYVQFYDLLDPEMLNQTVFVDSCALIIKYNTSGVTYKQCRLELAELADYNPDELIRIMGKRSYDAWNHMTNSRQTATADILCNDLKIQLNEVVPAQIATFQALGKLINIPYEQSVNRTTAFLYPIIALTLVLFIFIFMKTYYQFVRCIKIQILTISSPKHLYQILQFRPYLNRIYYNWSQ